MWTARLGFGPQLEAYAPGRFDDGEVRVDDAQLAARPCMQYYRFWDHGWVRWIDEPTNEVFLEAALKDAMQQRVVAFGVNVFHPKIVLGNPAEGPANPALNDKYELLQLTKGFAAVSLYADKVLPLARGRWGTFDARVGAGVGMYLGYARSITSAGARDEAPGIVGGFITLRHGLEYTEPSGHFSLGMNLDLSGGILDFPLRGGRGRHDVRAWKGGLHVGVQF